MYIFFFAGFLGGIIRGAVGLIKYTQSYKDVQIRPWYFSGMVFLGGIVGVVSAFIVHDLGITFLGVETVSPTIALIVGYAGGDFIENIFKIIIKKPNFYSAK